MSDFVASSADLNFGKTDVAMIAQNGRRVKASFESNNNTVSIVIGDELHFGKVSNITTDTISVTGKADKINLKTRERQNGANLRNTNVDIDIAQLNPLKGRIYIGTRIDSVRASGIPIRDTRGISIDIPSVVVEVDNGQMEISIEKATTSIPVKTVLRILRKNIPDSFLTDDSRITNDAIKIASNIFIPLSKGKITDIGRYKEWHNKVKIERLKDLKFDFKDNDLFVKGRIRATVIVSANKQHIKSDTCYTRKLGVKIPYPCVKTWHSVVEVDRFPFDIDIEGKVDISTNAPKRLDQLELVLRPEFNYVNIKNLQNDLEKMLLKKAYDKLREPITYNIGSSLTGRMGTLSTSRIQVDRATIERENRNLELTLSLKPN